MAQKDKEAAELMKLLGVTDTWMSMTLGGRTGSRIRLLHGSTSATASFAPRPMEERRRSDRLPPEQTRFAETAKLRPGFEVRVIDIGPKGVLIESPTRLHIGCRAELALFGTDSALRLDLAGTVRRCHVSGLSPVTYRGALEFDQAIEVQALQPFLATEAMSA